MLSGHIAINGITLPPTEARDGRVRSAPRAAVRVSLCTERFVVLSVLDRLSSRVGERSSKPNHRVADECVADPSLLAEIAEGLASKNTWLVADCAEVMAETARQGPELVVPYTCALAPLLTHPKPRVRWEATHAMAFVAPLAPDCMREKLPAVQEMIRRDTSTIVRDYAIDAVGNYAGTSVEAAAAAMPVLVEALDLWQGKHAAHALDGMRQVFAADPLREPELRAIGERYRNHSRSVTRRAGRALLRAMDPVEAEDAD